MLVIGCHNTVSYPSAPWHFGVSFDGLRRQYTSCASLKGDFSRLVEDPGKYVLVVCDCKDGLQDQLALANHDRFTSAVVGMLMKIRCDRVDGFWFSLTFHWIPLSTSWTQIALGFGTGLPSAPTTQPSKYLITPRQSQPTLGTVSSYSAVQDRQKQKIQAPDKTHAEDRWL